MQAHAADEVSELLSTIKSRLAIPEGDILEIGCGTGLFSSKLVDLLPGRKIICSDLSPGMLNACQLRLTLQNNSIEPVEFQILDAEYLPERTKYALIASSFALQWFFEPMEGLMRSFAALKPGGIVLFSLPGKGSFPEWKKAAELLNIPFTGNPLPGMDELQKLAVRCGMEFRIRDHFVQETYSDALTMLRSLKELGAGTQRHNMALSSLQLRKLMSELDSRGKPLISSYQVITGYCRRAYL